MGRHLVRDLLMAGHPVVGLDLHPADGNLPATLGPFTLAGPADGWPEAMVYQADFGRFFYVHCPLEEAGTIARLMDMLRPVMVYHLAAQSSAAVSFRNPGGTFAANIHGTLNLLEAARAVPDAERPAMLSVGSCEEYGPHPESAYPLREDTALNPLSPYGVSKVAQTLLCRQYVRSYDLPVVMARSFSHTGPGHDTRFAFPHFAHQIAAAEAGVGPAEILTGDLSPVRDFLDVRDVVTAYRLLLKEGRPGDIYHVSSGKSLTIGQGLEILIGGAKTPITVRRDPDLNRPSDTPIMVGDNSKLRRDTGWEPEWEINDTLMGLLDEARKEFQ
ncbi:MAG: GDP-mannose 4,6-dehydratase [Candidatus Krumholzibacteria bacterium]|nr:GDP-mannose 4,6-dehydratase [Candidatus Krumholzibacteria bacterium]